MKALIVTLLLVIFATNAYSQFGLSTSAGYGLSVNSRYETSLFQSVITVTPKFKLGDFQLGAVTNAVTNDSATTMLNGGQAAYDVWKITNNKKVSLSAHFLLGFEGDFVWGGGASYDVGNVGFDVTLSQEYLNKEFWFIGGVRFAIIPFKD